MLRTQTGLDKTPCIDRTLAVHDQMVIISQIARSRCPYRKHGGLEGIRH